VVGKIEINNISMTANCVVGAGMKVIKNMTEPGTYVGATAKKIKRDLPMT